MQLEAIFQDKSLKQKAKTAAIANMLVEGKLSMLQWLAFAKQAKSVEKATCIEALEYATQSQPSLATEQCWKFLIVSLADAEPRVKWESARAIANIAKQFSTKLKPAITALLANTEHAGTVVRWATAHALSEILLLNASINKELLPAIEAIASSEQENGVKKKYLTAIKKVKSKNKVV